ncbi:AAA family ATPase [Synechococcales cyanobacterium C]|uniref:AAA family ATPase n=1 Tax=Petrachloros mirabilis ULC683 TaxID=2781853 RepID=A0A8K2A1F9_9CYAN|nr:AAA family ATPase [Petrachloros mirabilis]NCJ08068.1 AAA family ATPase [Petrachloros mirabilis ULC683]
MQNKPIVCHVLIGAPGSGKTTLAQAWIKRDPSIVWVSTDAMRAELYGSEVQQLCWAEVEAAVAHKIQTCLQEGRSVLYDATNAKRAWRLEFLRKYSSPSVVWMGWWLQVDEAECKHRNKRRDRRVPDWVIEDYIQNLNRFKPIEAEGFVKVTKLELLDKEAEFEQTFQKIEDSLRSIHRVQAGRHNRRAQEELHRYSDFLEFERLMHLIALLIHYPGAGALRENNPSQLASVLKREVSDLPAYESDIDELSALLQKLHGNIYADRDAIAANLVWLQENRFANSVHSQKPIQCQREAGAFDYEFRHRYSDWQNFKRLMTIIRHLSYFPFRKPEEYDDISGLQEKFCNKLNQEYSSFIFLTKNVLRQDINFCLNPYSIMTSSKTRNSYFLGTGILAIDDLEHIFNILEAHKSLLDDPIAYESYKKFKSGLICLGKDIKEIYPTRTIMHQSIADPDLAPEHALSLEKAETYIENSTVIRLFKLTGRGSHTTDTPSGIKILPLQISFHRIAWYLGYVVLEEGENKDLLKFERMDRLSAESTLENKSKEFQKAKLKQLTRLTKASYSPFLGNSAKEQQDYLLKDTRKNVEILIDLKFETRLFEFIQMGTRRFPSLTARKNHLKGLLPRWTVEDDFELENWILGFGNEVTVLNSQSLAERIKKKAEAIAAVYNTP